ncbi:MAG: hypothetical protein KVP17_003863 [Porospora cf. gigantea B]|uniref:uncharacterized protein n=1 Tax=Porospora cf. gigantea B TaxID=2853592 RepID=UPI003571F7FB|nr:MAG: hypothetical protein KVP17_003863 [Porospora cf. gigantea B]
MKAAIGLAVSVLGVSLLPFWGYLLFIKSNSFPRSVNGQAAWQCLAAAGGYAILIVMLAPTVFPTSRKHGRTQLPQNTASTTRPLLDPVTPPPRKKKSRKKR